MALLVILMTAIEVYPSGYHPSFDRALAEAELVLQGDVVELWDPFDKDSRLFSGHRCYRFKVQKCCKGGLKPGTEVRFWDRHYNSTASYGIRFPGEYIVYLRPAELSAYEAKAVNPEGGSYYRPIRVRRGDDRYAGSRAAENYATELRLLDFFVDNPPPDKRKDYQQLLEADPDSVLLSYIVKDWPRPCTAEDIALFKRRVLASAGDELFVPSLMAELVKYPDAFSDAEIIALLKAGGEDAFSSLRPLMNKNNIDGVKPVLFDLLEQVEAGGPYKCLIETLAALAPGYFKERLLASHDFPVWKLLPCLKVLGLNGSDLGQADFPEEVFSVNHNRLLEVSKILEGDLFWISYPLLHSSNCEGMRKALPLLEPVLKGRDSPVRRACVALFRTYGVPVERMGSVYAVNYGNAPAACPIKLELSMARTRFQLGEDVMYTLKETAMADSGSFCFDGKELVTLHFEGHWHSPQSLNQKVWDNVEVPHDRFVSLGKGVTREQKLSLFRSIDRPGTYRITMNKCYVHDGSSHGLDAWTGVAFADNELVFTVEEP